MTRVWSAIRRWSIWQRPWSLVRFVISTIPLWIFLWLLNQNYVLTPTVSQAIIPGHRPNRVFRVDGDGNLVGYRQQSDGKWQWVLRQASTSFRLHLPRLVSAEVFTFRLAGAPSILTSLYNGPSRVGDVQRLLYDQQLDTLTWDRVRDGDLTIWSQPTVKPLTKIADVVKTVGAWPRLALVGFDRFAFFRLAKNPETSSSSIQHGLRGPHELYVYVAQPTLQLNFSVVDLHRRAGLDPLTIEVVAADQWRASGHVPALIYSVPADGNRLANHQPGTPRPVSIALKGLSEGVYRLNLQDSDEIIVSNLTVNQPFLNVINHVWLADGPGYVPGQAPRQASLTVESTDVTISAVSNSSYQTVHSGKAAVALDAKHASGQLTDLTSGQTVTLAKADAQIAAPGLISLDGSQLLPLDGPTSLPLAQIDDPTKYDYIVAQYVPQVATWPREFTVRVPANQTVVQQGDEVVSLGTDSADAAPQVRFMSAQAVLERGPFPWDKIFSRLRRLFTS